LISNYFFSFFEGTAMATKWTTTRAAEKQQKLVRCVAVADVDVAAVSGQQQQRSSSNIAAAATSERQQQS